MNNQTVKILENNDNFMKETQNVKVLNSFKKIKMRSLAKNQINQSNTNELNFCSLKDKHPEDINRITKSSIRDNKEIKKNFDQSRPFELNRNNLLLNEILFFPYSQSMKNLRKTKKGLIGQMIPEHNLILTNFQFNTFNSFLKKKCIDII